jgi:hypothetical protein
MAVSDARKLEIVEALYAATGVGDFDTAASYLTDDFFVTEADGLPMAGVYCGRGALKELFLKVFGMMDVADLDVAATTVGGDYAVRILSLRFEDPALAPATLCELFRFRGDKVCEIRPYYFDPAPVIAACKAKTRAAR